jgi:hypothetical protein
VRGDAALLCSPPVGEDEEHRLVTVPRTRGKFRSGLSVSLGLLIALFASGCRHLSSPSAEAVRPFKDHVLVYSLPSESDPAYARLNELFS